MYDCEEASPPRVASAHFDNAVAQFVVAFDRVTTMGGLPSVGVISCWALFQVRVRVRVRVRESSRAGHYSR